MAKNRLTNLNDHLFAQIERLADEGLAGEALVAEVRRSAAIVGAADQIVRIGELQVQAAKLLAVEGARVAPHLPMLQRADPAGLPGGVGAPGGGA